MLLLVSIFIVDAWSTLTLLCGKGAHRDALLFLTSVMLLLLSLSLFLFFFGTFSRARRMSFSKAFHIGDENAIPTAHPFLVIILEISLCCSCACVSACFFLPLNRFLTDLNCVESDAAGMQCAHNM